MKTKLLTCCIGLSLLLFSGIEARSQFLLAGQHNSGNYYVDIDPDTTLTGPNNHFPTLPAATFQIDINGDGNDDFFLYSYGSWVNGWGDSEISIKSHNAITCQIALGYQDTCHTPNSTYFLYNIAKSLKLGDTINRNLIWSDLDRLILTYTNWAWQVYSCNHSGFVNDSLGNYIAVRILQPNDTLYGWIKVANIDFLTFTVQGFACTKGSLGITEKSQSVKVYPNPANERVFIEKASPTGSVTIYNLNGLEVYCQKLFSTKTEVYFGKQDRGIYLAKIIDSNSVVVKMLVKE